MDTLCFASPIVCVAARALTRLDFEIARNALQVHGGVREAASFPCQYPSELMEGLHQARDADAAARFCADDASLGLSTGQQARVADVWRAQHPRLRAAQPAATGVHAGVPRVINSSVLVKALPSLRTLTLDPVASWVWESGVALESARSLRPVR